MREAIYSGVRNALFNQKPVPWLQKNILGSRWQESKTGQIRVYCCVLYVHLPSACFSIYWLLLAMWVISKYRWPGPPPTRGANQVVAVSTEMATLFRSRSPCPAGERRDRSRAVAWWWSLGSEMLSPQPTSCGYLRAAVPALPGWWPWLTHLLNSLLIPRCIWGEGSRRTTTPPLQFACDCTAVRTGAVQTLRTCVSIQHPRKKLTCSGQPVCHLLGEGP